MPNGLMMIVTMPTDARMSHPMSEVSWWRGVGTWMLWEKKRLVGWLHTKVKEVRFGEEDVRGRKGRR